MNTLPEPDNLTKPFSGTEKSAFFSSGSIVAGVGFLALLVFYFSGGNDSGPSPKSEQAAISQVSHQNQEKARQKELIVYLQQHPDDEFAHFQLGELVRDRAPFQALDNYSHVTPRHPRYFEAVEAIAEIAIEQDLPLQAKPALLTLVREYPQESRHHKNLARLLFKAADYDRALKYATRSIELGENQAQAHMLVANILRQAGRTSEMSGPLKQALYLDPELYEAHLNLAYAALYSGDLESAEREARWCLEQQPASITALRYLALIDRNQGKIEESVSHIEQARLINPQDFECLLLEADLLIFQRKGQQAYDLLKPLYSEWKTERRFIAALARAAGLTGKREESLLLQQENQLLIKENELKPSSLQSETVEGNRSRGGR